MELKINIIKDIKITIEKSAQNNDVVVLEIDWWNKYYWEAAVNFAFQYSEFFEIGEVTKIKAMKKLTDYKHSKKLCRELLEGAVDDTDIVIKDIEKKTDEEIFKELNTKLWENEW